MQEEREEGEAQTRRRRGRHRPGREQDPDIRLSKALSYALRHGASQLGLELQKDGFLPVDAILQHPQYRRYTVQDVQRVVDTSDKRRFALRTDPATGALQIRANQGHTLQVEELELTPISLGGGNLPAQAVHGTYLRHWPLIKAEGLRRLSRQHIHLAPGLPEDGGVISGMRSSCELAIFVELEKALSDGIPFFLSANHVILTPGNEHGVLPPKYFQKVLQLKPTSEFLATIISQSDGVSVAWMESVQGAGRIRTRPGPFASKFGVDATTPPARLINNSNLS
ncbi:tRNA 2'-phosphotransferase 1 isoform X2 [Hemitrygon akajei]